MRCFQHQASSKYKNRQHYGNIYKQKTKNKKAYN